MVSTAPLAFIGFNILNWGRVPAYTVVNKEQRTNKLVRSSLRVLDRSVSLTLAVHRLI